MANSPTGLAICVALAGTTLTILYGICKSRLCKSVCEDEEELFGRACEYFARHSRYYTSDVQLEFYALFKQATCGDAPCDGEDVMLDAWKGKRGLSSSDAEAEYVSFLDLHSPQWRGDDQVGGWAVGSIMADAIGETKVDDSFAGQICSIAADGDLSALTSRLRSVSSVDVRDIDGMTPLHWASDRGQVEIVQYLLVHRADPNALDHSLNSPLHIAGMAGQKEIVRLLIDAKADLSLVNTEGDSAHAILNIMTTYCVYRKIVKEESITELVNRLTNLFGDGEPCDFFSESLCFNPQNEAGNMNYINRDVFVDIQYSATDDRICNLTRVGASVVVKNRAASATVMTRSTAEVNIRRMFFKGGFFVKSDYAKKGLVFKTRDNQNISLTRPYNAVLNETLLYEKHLAAWTPLPGHLPFGTDYLLEISQHSPSEALIDMTVLNLRTMLDKLV